MTDVTYNGWTNYPTWAVGMWLDGNYDGPGTYYGTIEVVQDALKLDHPTSEYWTSDESRRYAVADALKEWAEREQPDTCSLAADLAGYALACVDWHELADAWIETLTEEEVMS